ncbi:NADP-dependent oxidoreductase [Parachryseolinea silvisoli]|uniref:NADP-dependent oxidoreductase n=1 Tax=Parachryseolinea silvisoli TaxID=2873601 RepID=UPI002265B6D2|nr:NADP-dependent oxidoreductase [Parachryseolinea silvisoli]MCD9018618.1 NADP-dependent oxidoreductase [Parachryseolinea silvisoli]
MKAIILKAPGGIDQLQYTELPQPAVGENDVLIQVKAISLNPVDVKTRAGKGVYGRLKELTPIVIGWDIAGIVAAAGASVTTFRPGDAVFGMVNFPGHGQGYAEYVAAPAHHLAHKPANISFEEAAAATLAPLTAWQAMANHPQVGPGKRVLIHAAAGGVGHFAVQLAKHRGAHVIGTSSAANKDFVLGLGADEHIDYRAQPFEQVAGSVDFVLDTLGGDTIDRSLTIINRSGAIISIVSGLSEAVVQKSKDKGVDGSFMLVQSNGADLEAIAALLAKGSLKAHVSQVFSFSEMGAAHLHVETGRTVGKIVVRV